MRLIDADKLTKAIVNTPTQYTNKDLSLSAQLNGVAFRQIEILGMIEAQSTVEWIPCSKRLPEDYHAVNVTWVNRNPEPYYMHIKDKPFTATACYHNRKWYWYSSVIEDLIAEHDGDPLAEIDDGIEIIAWMPLPEVYAEEVNKCG